MPKLYIISGCNGAGKTTASYTILPELLECREFVNSDEFAKFLSPFDPSTASVGASRMMISKVHYLMDRGLTFSIETTLATRSLLGVVREAKNKGYTVQLLYFWLNSPELAIARIKLRVAAGGHNIADDVVRRRYYLGLQYLFDTYIPECERWLLVDNSNSPFSTVAEGIGTVKFIRDNEKYALIWNQAHPDE